ncbi:hypothetical protein ACFH04_00620 [Streptomyces noboritoensis]|uniref:Uncharacterized protein n=1 Tax=Streptomyces noboritoensis TaxID=67337 RepID=A0ABV6T8X7_9ACTN
MREAFLVGRGRLLKTAPTALLTRPSLQHRLEDRVLGTQQGHGRQLFGPPTSPFTERPVQ